MILIKDILMGRDLEYPLNDEQGVNLKILHIAICKLVELYGKPVQLTSGYRPGHYNKLAKGGSRSAHLTCEAVDLADKSRDLTNFCTDEVLEQCGLWMEDPNVARSWVHLQIRKPKSRCDDRVRVFKP